MRKFTIIIVSKKAFYVVCTAFIYGRVFIRSGAGIVADSDPEKEFEECLNKAKASLKALQLAQEEEL